MSLINVCNVTKNYGKVEALRGVSFEVGPGEIVGLIGADGAGKTTLFRILTTLLLPHTGSASVCGLDVVRDYRAIRREVGYMPGRFSLYQDLSVEENLHFFAALFKTSVEDNYALIKDIYEQIAPFKKRRAGALSGGMKQKLALCCALIHRPQVLFLDEPTTGVDPVSRKELWQMLHRLRQTGIAILVSTPYMDEAMQCDRIVLLQQGKVMKIETPQAIVAEYDRALWAVSADQMSSLLQTLRALPYVTSCYAFGDSHHLTVTPEASQEELRAFLPTQGYTAVEVRRIDPTIEDCFIALQQ